MPWKLCLIQEFCPPKFVVNEQKILNAVEPADQKVRGKSFLKELEMKNINVTFCNV